MIVPAVTALYASLTSLLLLVFALRISLLRRELKVNLGDGGHPRLQRAIRVHGNAVEWTLPALLLLLVAELNHAPLIFLHGCGAALFVARIAHGVGLSRVAGTSAGRAGGTLVTWIVIGALSAWNIWAFARPVAS